MYHHRLQFTLVFAIALTLFNSSYVPLSHGLALENNIVSNPGFEDAGCPAWRNTSTIGGGVLKICDTINPHQPSTHSVKMNATQADAATRRSCQPGTGCKDFVRATVQQFMPLGSSTPDLDSLPNSPTSFSAWWYVDAALYGMIGMYSLHTSVAFRDVGTNVVYSIEYWYGISDLSPPNIYLGTIPALGQWFQMTRNLKQDVQALNVPNPAVTKVESIMFGAYGNVTHGENAYLDDVSLSFIPHPVPLFSASPAVGQVPLTVNFDGTGTTETAGGPGVSSYKWEFGDGTPAASGVNGRVAHTYSNAGNFTAVLTVTDVNGQSRSVSSRIIVSGDSSWLNLAIASGFGLVLVAALFFAVRGRSHPKTTKSRSRLRKQTHRLSMDLGNRV